MKRDNPAYKKTRADDLVNMQTGLFGYKGRVHYACAPCIDDWIATQEGLSNAEFFAATARRLDEEIYRNYRLIRTISWHLTYLIMGKITFLIIRKRIKFNLSNTYDNKSTR